jgi:hypothetical protein
MSIVDNTSIPNHPVVDGGGVDVDIHSRPHDSTDITHAKYDTNIANVDAATNPTYHNTNEHHNVRNDVPDMNAQTKCDEVNVQHDIINERNCINERNNINERNIIDERVDEDQQLK